MEVSVGGMRVSYTFSVPFLENKKLKRIVDSVREDVELQTFWRCANVMAISRMGYTDHGPTHVKIVANSALKILRILVNSGVVPNIVKDYNLTNEDAEVVVVLSSVFHDLGMVVTRRGMKSTVSCWLFVFCSGTFAQCTQKRRVL